MSTENDPVAPALPRGAVGRAIESDLAALAADVSLTAAQRLSVTRERMRLAMTNPNRRPPRPSAAASSLPTSGLWDLVRKIPGSAVIVETLENWWRRNPWRTPMLVAAEAANTLVRPLARKRPVTVVAGALVFGAVVVWARPWRWIARPALLATLLPQVAKRVVTNLPIESWLSLIGRLSEPRARTSAAVTD